MEEFVVISKRNIPDAHNKNICRSHIQSSKLHARIHFCSTWRLWKRAMACHSNNTKSDHGFANEAKGTNQVKAEKRMQVGHEGERDILEMESLELKMYSR